MVKDIEQHFIKIQNNSKRSNDCRTLCISRKLKTMTFSIKTTWYNSYSKIKTFVLLQQNVIWQNNKLSRRLITLYVQSVGLGFRHIILEKICINCHGLTLIWDVLLYFQLVFNIIIMNRNKLIYSQAIALENIGWLFWKFCY